MLRIFGKKMDGAIRGFRVSELHFSSNVITIIKSEKDSWQCM
jgi:hypothetical protein